MGRKRQYACQEGLVPLCIVERLYESQQSACRERAQPAKSRNSALVCENHNIEHLKISIEGELS